MMIFMIMMMMIMTTTTTRTMATADDAPTPPLRFVHRSIATSTAGWARPRAVRGSLSFLLRNTQMKRRLPPRHARMKLRTREGRG
jgi:hypothetical protein